jgi:hypothetical protein
MEKRNNHGPSPLLAVYPSPTIACHHQEKMIHLKEKRDYDVFIKTLVDDNGYPSPIIACRKQEKMIHLKENRDYDVFIETLGDDNGSLSSRSSSSSGDAILKWHQLSALENELLLDGPKKEREACSKNTDSHVLIASNVPSEQVRVPNGFTNRMKDIKARRRQLTPLAGSQKERRVGEPFRSQRTKLNKLRASRSESERQLRDLLDHQQTQPRVIEPVVYDDLRDELLAAYQVIHQQQSHLNELETTRVPSVKPSEDKDIILQLEDRLSRLEIDRACGELQLRNRISSDGMAYQESIRQWKKEATSWQNRFEESWVDHQSQIEYWKGQSELWKGRANKAEQEFSRSLEGNDSLVLELLKTKETVEQLAGWNHDDGEQTLQYLPPVPVHSSQPPDHQASFLLEAMQRKPPTTSRLSLKSRIQIRMGDVFLLATSSIEKSSRDKKLLVRLPNESDKLDDGLLQMRTKKSMSVSRRKMLDCRNLLNDDEATGTAPTIWYDCDLGGGINMGGEQ